MRKINPKIAVNIDPPKLAKTAGLEYVNDQIPGISRKKRGKNFQYFSADGQIIKDHEEIKRINSLAIPPAYQNVWICPRPNGHLQATGRDVKGRKQYRYHPKWREVSDETKYAKMIAFGQALPQIRQRVQQDLALKGLPKHKILATIVQLLETTLIRVGNEEYVQQNQSFGLTTMRNRHVEIDHTHIEFQFKGKSGLKHKIDLDDPRLARIIKRCQDLPGQELFQYLDEEGQAQPISSTDVNQYLQEITQEHFTAKDFRTWAGTVLAAFTLCEYEDFKTQTQAKKDIVKAVETVSKRLGNTPAICRKCYIHPEVFNVYLEGSLQNALKSPSKRKQLAKLIGLNDQETAVLKFLKKRLAHEIEQLKD